MNKMTQQPEALRLAELLDGDKPMHCEAAAAELRRLHTEGEAWKRWCQEAEERGAALEQAGRQALEALEVSTDWDMNATGKQAQSMRAITALRQALGDKND